jgi:hypothetical protein
MICLILFVTFYINRYLHPWSAVIYPWP